LSSNDKKQRIEAAISVVQNLTDDGWSLSYAIGFLRKSGLYKKEIKQNLKNHPKYVEISKKIKKQNDLKSRFSK